MSDIELKPVFAVSKAKDGSDIIMLGFTKASWDAMQGGKCSDIDLKRVGINTKLLIFGAETHADVMNVLQQTFADAGVTINDQRNRDFSIKEEKK